MTILAGTLWVGALKRRVEERTETIRATLESTAEGILVMDSAGTIVEHNQKFAKLWGVPEVVCKALDYRRLLDIVEPQLLNAEAFADQLEAAHANTKAKTDDVIELKYGRIFERHSEPQTVKGKNVGRVWGFRDLLKSVDRPVNCSTWRARMLSQVFPTGGPFSNFYRANTRRERSLDAVTVIMADLDGFKKINDRFGHAAGDAMLKETARRLRSCSRGSDVAGRYGGEEFLIVLPGCDERSAGLRAEEFRHVVESYPVLAGDREIAVTCSFGVASTREGTRSMSHLLQAADAALYQARKAGRNCVAMANLDHELAIVSVG